MVVCVCVCAMESSSQDYLIALPFPSPGDLPDPGIEPSSLASLALAGRFFTNAPPGKPELWLIRCKDTFLHTGFLHYPQVELSNEVFGKSK